MTTHPASDIVQRHVAAATERAHQNGSATAAAAASRPPGQAQQHSALDTARSVLLLAAAALAAGATAGVLSYLLFVKAAPQRQRGSRKAGSTNEPQNDFHLQPRSASEPKLQLSSQKSEPGESEARRMGAHQHAAGGQGHALSSIAAGWAHLKPHAHSGSNSSLAEAGKFAALSSSKRQLHSGFPRFVNCDRVLPEAVASACGVRLLQMGVIAITHAGWMFSMQDCRDPLAGVVNNLQQSPAPSSQRLQQHPRQRLAGRLWGLARRHCSCRPPATRWRQADAAHRTLCHHCAAAPRRQTWYPAGEDGQTDTLTGP
jgi:hypothetical protein